MPMPHPDRRTILTGTAAAAALAATPALSQATRTTKPAAMPLPVARKEPVTDTYFGETITDPYRWMENEKDPDWQPWMKGQGDHARAMFDAIPGRDALEKRIAALSGDTEVIGAVQEAGGRLFVRTRPVGADNFMLTVREGLTGKPRVLIDPTAMKAPDGTHVSLDWYVPSPNGKYVVYGLSPAGSENSVTHIMEVDTGTILPERIDRTQYANPSWLPDSSGFFFNRLALDAKPDTTDYYKNSVAWLHRLNTDPATDIPVMRAGLDPNIPIDPIEFPAIFCTPGSDWVLGALFGGVRRNNPVFCATLASAASGKPVWRRIAGVEDEITNAALRSDSLYLLTTKNADKGRVLKLPLANPVLAEAKEVVPAGPTVIDAIAVTSNGLFVQDMDGGYSQLRFLDAEDRLRPIALPFEGTVAGVSATTDSPTAYVTLTGYVNPTEIFTLDGARGTLVPTTLQPKPDLDLSPYEAIRTYATARDGVKVPLSIIRKKGLKLDGSNPTLVDAYGSYQITSSPYFSARSIAWLEKGGVYATAGVRGGGEYGKDWWLAGKGLNKARTWRDLIDCCRHLIALKITSPAKLAIQGGSAGGITVGRALTEEPALFGAVVANVGVHNTLRTETGQNGPPNIPEFGTVTEPDGYRGLKAMDSYHAVQDGVRYPAVLLTTGIQDPRVDPWQVAKMAARLQDATASGRPILLRVDYDAGHGLGSTRSQRDRETADTWAFLFWQLGVKGWAPA